MIWSLLKKIHEFLCCISESDKPSQSQKSLDGLTAPTVVCLACTMVLYMPLPSVDITYNIFTKLMMALG
jgi:hypothetical protein